MRREPLAYDDSIIDGEPFWHEFIRANPDKDDKIRIGFRTPGRSGKLPRVWSPETPPPEDR